MFTTITLEEAQANLKELIHRLSPGEELVITENQLPVAKLVSEPSSKAKPPRPGPGVCKAKFSTWRPISTLR